MNKQFLKSIITGIFMGLILLGVFVLLTRTFGHKELDDVHPRIMDTDDPYLQRSKYVWVIPLYMDDPISNYPEWVDRLKKSGKIIGLHGVKHTYREFGRDLPLEYIDRGVQEFRKAFGYYPKYFKPPVLDLTEHNGNIIRAYGMEIKSWFNQAIYSVFHSDKHRTKEGGLEGEAITY